MKPVKIELYVEELVLQDFAPGERFQIGDAVQHELARLLAGQGVPDWFSQGGEVGHLDGGIFEISPGSKAGKVGAQVAQAVYRGLMK